MKNKKFYKEMSERLREANAHMADEITMLMEVVTESQDEICGCIEIEGVRTSSSYQDLINILLVNGYTVTAKPLHDNTKLQIIIKEKGE